MADIEKLIKNGLIGASMAIASDVALHGGIPIETAAVIGGMAAEVMGLSENEAEEPKSWSSAERRESSNTNNYDLIKFNTRHNSQSNSSVGQAQDVGFNRLHVLHHDADKDETHAPFPEGDGRENFAFTETSNYAERLEYKPFESQTATSESCRTESCNTDNCATTARKPKKEVPVEVQHSILKWKGKSPSRTCDKHGVEMPTNSCYSCNSGQKCEHLSIYDGTHKKAHCTYSQTQPLPMPRDDKTVNVRRGWNPISLRHVKRARLTGIERNNLLGLVDKTNVDDQDSLKQELADHIDPALTYAENKTALQGYLAGVTPLNTDVTDREIKEYESHINAIDPAEVERANDTFLIESLKERAAQGDSSASMQLELMEIKRDGFAQMEFGAPKLEASSISESAPDPAMSWCSSTPETIKFSETFVPPPEAFNPAASWEAPMQITAKPMQKPQI